jgi:hypothetical protein
MTDDWLADVVIVNESRDVGDAGDVSIFRNADEACRSLEHWWVENGEGFAFTAAGERLTLDVDERGRVIVAGKQMVPDGPDIVRGWLLASAKALLDVRRAKAARGKTVLARAEERRQLPTSVEGLIAYLGFGS